MAAKQLFGGTDLTMSLPLLSLSLSARWCKDENQQRTLKPYIPALVLIVVDLIVMAVFPHLAPKLLTNTAGNFIEMLSILPPGIYFTWFTGYLGTKRNSNALPRSGCRDARSNP